MNYWVVGASWNGEEDQSEKFIKYGYWLLGTDKRPLTQVKQEKFRDEIKVDDRIAIKKMLGKGKKDIQIKAIGIVKEISDKDNNHDKRIHVNWVATNLNRIVPSKGCYSAIRKPFKIENKKHTEWIKSAFHL